MSVAAVPSWHCPRCGSDASLHEMGLLVLAFSRQVPGRKVCMGAGEYARAKAAGHVW